MKISKFIKQAGTKGVYKGVNSQDTVTIVRDINCWVLDIVHTDGKWNVSSHNTWDEAVREAETRSPWFVDLHFNPLTESYE